MITKIEAAKRQLEVAIKLHFEGVDRLSCYALAVASREITDALFEKRRNVIFQRDLARLGELRFSFREEIDLIVKPEHIKEVRILHRKLQNFLKHADKDHDKVIDEVDAKNVAIAIMTAVRNYSLIDMTWTPAMSIFFTWYAVTYPNHVKSGGDDEFWAKIDDLRLQATDLDPDSILYSCLLAVQEAAPHLFPRKVRASDARTNSIIL
jgi:hypothetical protein